MIKLITNSAGLCSEHRIENLMSSLFKTVDIPQSPHACLLDATLLLKSIKKIHDMKMRSLDSHCLVGNEQKPLKRSHPIHKSYEKKTKK